MTNWCPVNKREWYNIIIVYTQVSGIAHSAVSFSSVVTSLNNKGCNKIYFSANISTFHNFDLVLDNLFCARFKYKSLKYGLIKYHACISFTVTCK